MEIPNQNRGIYQILIAPLCGLYAAFMRRTVLCYCGALNNRETRSLLIVVPCLLITSAWVSLTAPLTAADSTSATNSTAPARYPWFRSRRHAESRWPAIRVGERDHPQPGWRCHSKSDYST